MTQAEVFRAAAQVLDATGIGWWLSDGAALGAVRHATFLPTDPDVDLGFWAADRPTVEVAFTEAGWRPSKSRDLKFIRDGIKVDLHPHKRDGDVVRFELGAGRFHYRFPARLFDRFATVEFCGRRALIPTPVNDYLEAHYGPDWRTPKAPWRWDVDPPCLQRVGA